MKDLGMIERDRTCLVVMDVQEKFRPVMHGFAKAAGNVEKLAKAFRALNIPIIATEQNPGKLGRTVSGVSKAIGDFEPVEKLHFSCFGVPGFESKLKRLKARDLVLCGLETHICILKTALDARKRGFRVHIASDAVTSRRKEDRDFGLERMSESGIFLTTAESLIFQLIDKASKRADYMEVFEIIK